MLGEIRLPNNKIILGGFGGRKSACDDELTSAMTHFWGRLQNYKGRHARDHAIATLSNLERDGHNMTHHNGKGKYIICAKRFFEDGIDEAYNSWIHNDRCMGVHLVKIEKLSERIVITMEGSRFGLIKTLTKDQVESGRFACNQTDVNQDSPRRAIPPPMNNLQRTSEPDIQNMTSRCIREEHMISKQNQNKNRGDIHHYGTPKNQETQHRKEEYYARQFESRKNRQCKTRISKTRKRTKGEEPHKFTKDDNGTSKKYKRKQRYRTKDIVSLNQTHLHDHVEQHEFFAQTNKVENTCPSNDTQHIDKEESIAWQIMKQVYNTNKSMHDQANNTMNTTQESMIEEQDNTQTLDDTFCELDTNITRIPMLSNDESKGDNATTTSTKQHE